MRFDACGRVGSVVASGLLMVLCSVSWAESPVRGVGERSFEPPSAGPFRFDATSFAAADGLRGAGGASWAGAAPVGRPSLRGRSFYGDHFLPRLDRRIQQLTPLVHRPDQGLSIHEHLLYDQVNDQASGSLRSATTKALRDYLLETSPFLGRVTSIDLGRGAAAAGTGSGRRRGARFDLRLSDRESTVRMRLPAGNQSLAISVGTQGTVGLRLRRPGWGQGGLFTEFQPDEQTFRVGFRVGMQ